MTLQQLFSIFGKVDWRKTSPQLAATGVFSDSRKISQDTVFVATAGVNSDGHDYISTAIDQGAVALVVESLEQVPDKFNGAVLQVLDSKIAYSELLSNFYSRPEEKLIAIGVTGTNGKTSSCYILEALFNEADVPCGVIGTIDHHFKDKTWATSLTTPDTASFFERLKNFVDLGAKAFVMEVSSHSLKQLRVPVDFDLAIFTNFTRDHLDYHKTMEDYFASKQLLFTDQMKQQDDVFALFNQDDPQVSQTKVGHGVQRLTFGKHNSDYNFALTSSQFSGVTFTVTEKRGGVEDGTHEYTTNMVGQHNVYNLVGAIAAARAWNIPHVVCQRAIKKFKGIPGRLERVEDKTGRHIFVDYAHTPDALEKVLKNLSELKTQHNTSSKIITIFGCGGDRDKGKRPLMAQVAEKFSDELIVTSDNPRGEDPEVIIDEIFSGLKNKSAHRQSDRAKALQKALEISGPGDVILIAGKGHENYQLVGTQTLPFSDVAVMKKLLQAGT